jgi:hypothetical protein
MDPSDHTRLSADEMTPENLHGATIYGPEDENVGSIAHLHGSTVVVDVGGFFGIGAKPVAIPMAELDVMRDEDGIIHAATRLTADQLKALPEHTDS